MFKLLIIGHLIGDFYIQTDRIAEKKKRNLDMLFKHCISYALILLLCGFLYLTRAEIIKYIIFIALLGVLHGIIDYLKIRIEKRGSIAGIQGIYLFLADQVLHVGIIIFGCRLFGFGDGNILNIFDMMAGILICGRPASVFVKMVFSTIPDRGRKEIKGSEQPQGGDENPRVGSYIGILEREIIYFLGIMGQFSAIGFVLTAKSIARYKQLEEQQFAERYLVGTLLSTVIAIACAGIYNYLC